MRRPSEPFAPVAQRTLAAPSSVTGTDSPSTIAVVMASARLGAGWVWSITATEAIDPPSTTAVLAKPTIAMGLTERGYAFPMQLWPRAIKAGLRITELPVSLIYNDPNRQFGGGLDDPGDRLEHYLEVLCSETRR